MHEAPETYSDPVDKSPGDQPAWLFPLVIAGGTAGIILALTLLLATWLLVQRRSGRAILPVPVVQHPDYLPATERRPTDDPSPRRISEETNVAVKTPAALPDTVTVASTTSDTIAESEAVDKQEEEGSAVSAGKEPGLPVIVERPQRSPESKPAQEDTPAEHAGHTTGAPPKNSSAKKGDRASTRSVRTTSALQPATRPAKPTPRALEKARQELLQEEGETHPEAATPDARRAAAEALLERAGEEQDPTLRYAMLDRARSLAVEAGELRLPFAAIEQIRRMYDTDVLPLKIATLEKLSAGADSVQQRQALALLAADVSRLAVEADEFASARTLLDMGLNFARGIKDSELQRSLLEQARQLESENSKWQAAQEARKTLLHNVDDGDANLALGKYLCFVRQRWETGLAHLVQGSDAVLVRIAEQDAREPRQAEQQVQLADDWYDWGQHAGVDDQRGAWSRAREYYEEALPGLSGSARRDVDRRLRELAEALDGSGDEPIAVVRLPWLDGPAGQLQTYDGHTDHITALAVSASGNLLASAAEDSSVCLWHLPTGKRIWRHTAETRNLNGVAVTPDERLVISNHDNNQLFLLNATTGKPVTQIPTSARSPTELDVTPDGECLIWATRSRPPNLLIWSLSHHRVLARLGEGEYPGVIDVSADGRFVVTGDSHGVVRLWDTVAGTAIRELAIHQDAITDIALSPGGDLVASATYDKLDVRELDTGESRLCLDVPSARTVAFSPDGRRLVSGGFREEVFVWDLASGHQLASLRAERAFSDRYVLRLAFLPDPRGLVTGATDGRIRLWRLPD